MGFNVWLILTESPNHLWSVCSLSVNPPWAGGLISLITAFMWPLSVADDVRVAAPALRVRLCLWRIKRVCFHSSTCEQSRNRLFYSSGGVSEQDVIPWNENRTTGAAICSALLRKTITELLVDRSAAGSSVCVPVQKEDNSVGWWMN